MIDAHTLAFGHHVLTIHMCIADRFFMTRGVYDENITQHNAQQF